MAQNDAELAHLESQRNSRQPDGDSDTDEGFGNESPGESSQEEIYQPSNAQSKSGLKSESPSEAQNSSNLNAISSHVDEPKMVGGFVEEKADENAKESTQGPSRLDSGVSDAGVSDSTSHIPLQSSMSSIQNVSKDSVAEDQNSVDVLANGGHINSTFNGVSNPVSTPSPVGGVSAQTANTQVTSSLMSDPTSLSAFTSTTLPAALPKTRLPHDVIGLFEDRIKEDPRGDTEAWLGLIHEHRKRNKLDDARAVFDRFLKVFPTAVSLIS
jgi:cleavage stimulation factor subunit 3